MKIKIAKEILKNLTPVQLEQVRKDIREKNNFQPLFKWPENVKPLIRRVKNFMET